MSRVADRGSCSNADTEHNVGGDDPLTTKEGWRRFVDHQSQPPGLYAAAELARLSPGERAAYDEGRRGYHADLPVVNTPTIQKVISTSRLLMQLNRNQVSARRQTYADPYRGKHALYWLTISNGEVVAIDEQYVP